MRAQVSFEFILVFTLLFFVFTVVASVYTVFLNKADNIQKAAEAITKEIKMKSITASLSNSDIVIPVNLSNNLNGDKYILYFHAQDDFVQLRDANDNVISRSFLPDVTYLSGGATIMTVDPAQNDLRIEKGRGELRIVKA